MLIETERFLLRKLTTSDVTEKYLSWLSEQVTQQWIVSADTISDLDDLRVYVKKRTEAEDILFLGIFCKDSNLHIGNIKFEPIHVSEGRAELGVLIGDPNFRGKKVFAEVLDATSKWLKMHLKITQITLGVKRKNSVALKAYLNAGFVEAVSLDSSPNSMELRMILNI